MSTSTVTPDIIFDRMAELNKLVKENPVNIPIEVVANYLGIGLESVRAGIYNGTFRWGFAFQQMITSKKRFFVVPTLSFYLAVTQGHVFPCDELTD